MPTKGFFKDVSTVIDTTEFPLATTFNAFYSGYKKQKSMKYEVACGIATGLIVWAPVPGCAGPRADQDLLHVYKIYDKMLPWELYLGDQHYTGEPKSRITYSSDMTARAKHVRAIIEHLNGKIKKRWGALETPWRHGISKHHLMCKICHHISNICFHFKPVHRKPNPRLYDDSYG